MFNPKNILLVVAVVIMPSTSAAYECYSDFREIGAKRLAENKNHSNKLLEIVVTIQKAKQIDLPSAINEYKNFSGNDETRDIDKKITEIDAEIEKLNPKVKENSGEAQCLERMKLEQERSKVASQKFDEIGRALIPN